MKHQIYDYCGIASLPRRTSYSLLIIVPVWLLSMVLLPFGCTSMSNLKYPTANKGTKIAKPMKKPPIYHEIATFAGQVVSTSGKGIDSAKVEINGKIEKTKSNGHFKMTVKPSNRYVMNIRKEGFGLVSKIYTTGVQEGLWIMTPATTQTFDPKENILIQNIRMPNICNGTLSSQVDWSDYPNRRIPYFIDSDGSISDEVPDEVSKAVEFVENGDTCNPGISFAIQANSLVDSNGQPPPGEVQASIWTVDIYDPDSMPGDYTVMSDNREGYMVTYGAGGLNLTVKDRTYQLKKGKYATLTIPINPAQLKLVRKPEPKIPLLVYDEKAGIWKHIGEAHLNSKGDAYIAKVYHLTAFNMDIIKTDQACVRIDSRAIDGDYELEVAVPFGGDFIVRTKEVDNTPVKFHVLYNLPSNTNITLRAFRRVGTTIVPITDTVAVNTGNPQNPSTPNPPDYGPADNPYSACNAEVVLTEDSLSPRQLKITNMVGSQRLDQVVQVKIIPFGSTYTTADLLTPDSPTCWSLPGEYIGPGQSRTFDVTIGNNYLVFIGMGIWETDLVTGICNINYPWVKIRFFTDTNWNIYYPWIEVQVTDHVSGLWEWTITGSYTAGNLSLNPAGNPSLFFQITDYNPLAW